MFDLSYCQANNGGSVSFLGSLLDFSVEWDMGEYGN